jgi:small subunit ribosomal protein S16
MVKIRLRRTGAKKQPSYRVVVTDSSAPRDGRFIEIIGHYNPRTEPVTVNLQEDRALHWLLVGAQMTDPVERLLKNLGTLDRLARLKEGVELEELLSEAEAAHEKHAEEAKAPVEATAKKKKTKKQAKAEEAVQVEVSEPEVSEPEVSEPEVSEPEVSEAEVSEAEVSAAEVSAAKVSDVVASEAEASEEVTEDLEETSSEDAQD